jgi:phosphinothricin acetyltransferase
MSTSALTIDAMRPDDWPAVAEIYLQGIATGMATFETVVPAWVTWDRSHLMTGRLVARQDGVPAGWAALSPVSARHAYRGVAEVSIYVATAQRGAGVGRALLTALVGASEAAGLWTLQATLFPENARSRALHRACGFREVGRRERIARLDGVWRDTILMERRSDRVGRE